MWRHISRHFRPPNLGQRVRARDIFHTRHPPEYLAAGALLSLLAPHLPIAPPPQVGPGRGPLTSRRRVLASYCGPPTEAIDHHQVEGGKHLGWGGRARVGAGPQLAPSSVINVIQIPSATTDVDATSTNWPRAHVRVVGARRATRTGWPAMAMAIAIALARPACTRPSLAHSHAWRAQRALTVTCQEDEAIKVKVVVGGR